MIRSISLRRSIRESQETCPGFDSKLRKSRHERIATIAIHLVSRNPNPELVKSRRMMFGQWNAL
jgi:hypothetical protein